MTSQIRDRVRRWGVAADQMFRLPLTRLRLWMAALAVLALSAVAAPALAAPALDDASERLDRIAPQPQQTRLLPSQRAGVSFTQCLHGGGGPDTTYTLVFGQLPPGVNFESRLDGGWALCFYGTPTEVGSFRFDILVRDGAASGNNSYEIYILEPRLSLSPPSGSLGVAALQTPFRHDFATSGGNPDYTYTSTTLPPGLALSPQGTLSGVPAVPGTFTFNITARDSTTGVGAPFTTTTGYALTVVVPPLITTGTLPNGRVGDAYAYTLGRTGGAGPYSFDVSAGALPAGLALSSGGVLSGTPVQAGDFSVTIRLTDANGMMDERAYAIEIEGLPPVISSVSPELIHGRGAFVVLNGEHLAPLSSLTTNGAAITPEFSQNTRIAFFAPSGLSSGPLQIEVTTPAGSASIGIDVDTVPPEFASFPSDIEVFTAPGVPWAAASWDEPTATDNFPGVTVAQWSGRASGSNFPVGSSENHYRAVDAAGNYTDAVLTVTVIQTPAPVLTLTPDSGALPGATQGAFYSHAFAVSGGSGAYSYGISGQVPAGLTISFDGVLSGAPAAAGSYSFNVFASERGSGGHVRVEGSFTLEVAASESSSVVLTPRIGEEFSFDLPGFACAPPTGLPAGLGFERISAEKSRLRGTATSMQTVTVDISCFWTAELAGVPMPTTYEFRPVAPNLTLSPADGDLGVAVVNVGYSRSFAAAGGTPSYAYMATGSLPPGLSLAPDGTLGGAPNTPGRYEFLIGARDSTAGPGAPFSTGGAYTLTVIVPPAISRAALPDGRISYPYESTLTGAGGVGPYSFSVTGGRLPAGLTLSSDGILSGTPTEAGQSFDVTITLADANGMTAAADYRFRIFSPGPLAIDQSLSPLQVGVPASGLVQARGGTPPYTYSLVDVGSVPPGLTVDPVTGVLSGIPTAAGRYHFSFRAVDSSTGEGAPFVGHQTLGGFEVRAPQIVLAPDAGALPGAARGTAYSQRFTATGGIEPYAYAITDGDLPTGLTLTSDGVLAGAPTATGNFSFTVTATDSSGGGPFQVHGDFTLDVTAPSPPAVVLTPRIGEAFSFDIRGYWCDARTALPAGVNFEQGAYDVSRLYGTPTSMETVVFYIYCYRNPNPFQTTAIGTRYEFRPLAPNLTLSPAAGALDVAALQQPFGMSFAAAGGTPGYAYTATGLLPPGLLLGPDGTLSGQPNVPGRYVFQITAHDSTTGPGAPFATANAYTLDVVVPPVVATDTLPDGKIGQVYDQTLAGAAGVGPYEFSVSGGRLPAGLTLAAGGGISGTPTEAGDFNVTISLTDANGMTAERSYAFAVEATLPSYTTPNPAMDLMSFRVGVPVDVQVTAYGATPPYAFHGVSLPVGVTMTPDGRVTGTPTESDIINVHFTITDSSTGTGAPFVRTIAYGPVAVHGPDLTLTPAAGALPDWPVNVPYSRSFTAGGGTAPYTYAITGDTPPGLTLSADGVLSGTPDTAGTFAFRVTATDSTTGDGPNSIAANYTLTIGDALVLTTATLPDGRALDFYDLTLAAAGGTAPYSFAISSGDLPTGMTLSSSGRLSGRPWYDGAYDITVRVQDSSAGPGGPRVETFDLSLSVAGRPPVIISMTPDSMVVGSSNISLNLNGDFVIPNGGVLTIEFVAPDGRVARFGEWHGDPLVAPSRANNFSLHFDGFIPLDLLQNAGVAAIRVNDAYGTVEHPFQILPAPPAIDAASPEVIGGAGGTVRLTGTHLAPIVSLAANGAPIVPTIASATEIVVDVPAGLSDGPLQFHLTTAGGEAFSSVTVDATPPVIAGLPADITADTDPGLDTAVVTWTEPTVTDNAPGATITQTAGPASGSAFPLGVTAVTYEARDAAGNTVSASFTVTVTDNEDPVIAGLPADISVETDPGLFVAVVTWTEPTATDNVAGATIAHIAGPASGEAFPIGVTTVTYEATDAAGNAVTASFTVTVSDSEDPVIAGLPADITVDTDAGQPTAIVSWIEPTVTDNAPGATIAQTAGLASGSAFPLGVTTVTYEATDAAGNTVSESFTVTVSDAELPVIVGLPADISVDTDAGQPTAAVSWTEPTVTDNAPGATIAQVAGLASGEAFPIGVTIVTYEARDTAGNTVSESFTVTVSDAELPVIVGLPADISADTDVGLATAVVSWTEPTVIDNAPGATIAQVAGLASGEAFPIGVTTVTYEARDTAGNTVSESFTVSVSDAELPVIVGLPADISVDTDPGLATATVSWTEPTVTDNAPGATITQTAGLASGEAFPIGVTTVTYEAVDAAGNTVSESFTVTVTDAELPVIVGLSPDIAVDTDAGLATATVSWTEPTVTDNAPGATIAQVAGLASGSAFPIGVTTVTYEAEDAAGNTVSESFTVSVSDAELPVIVGLSPDISVDTDPGQPTAVVSWTQPTVTDNAPGATITQTAGFASGSAFPIGTTTVTYEARDAAGNVVTASFTVAVGDAEAPVITGMPADMSFDIDYPETSRTVTWTEPSATDNAPGVSIAQVAGPASGSAFPIGVTTVTYEARDAAGNTAEASFTVAVAQTPPGSIRFVVNASDDGAFAFTSATPELNFTVQTSGGSGSGPTVQIRPGLYALAFTTPTGFGLTGASCSPSTSSVDIAARTASVSVASNVAVVCTIQALPARRETVEAIGAALDASARLIIANAPDVGRRIDRLNGGGGAPGSVSAFGKTFASNLPFSATLGVNEIRFAASLSGLRASRAARTGFNARTGADGVPAALAASAAPAAGLAATDAADAMTAQRGPRFDAWVEGVVAGFNGAIDTSGDFAVIHAGADWLISDDVLIGLGVQADWLKTDTRSGSVESAGWLAGPYLTARLAPNLYLDLRAAWGGAAFDVSPFGTYTDRVDSTRSLYSGALIGDFRTGNLTIRPQARITWYREETDAYTDSLSVAIPAIEITTGVFSLGPTFEWTIQRDSGAVLTPSLGFDLIWTFEQQNTATQFTGAPGLDDTGLRARIEAGIGYTSQAGVQLGGSIFYDGIGASQYEAWGAKASIRFGF